MNNVLEEKVKRFMIVSGALVFICLVCLFVSIRFIDKYRNKVAETALLEQRLEDIEQEIKKQEIRTQELEAARYDLSLKKRKIGNDYATIQEKYRSLGKTIKTLVHDVSDLKKVMKFVKNNAPDPVIGDVDSSAQQAQLTELKKQNEELTKELAARTREKMILNIALETQAHRLGISENYDPELKTILKSLITTLQ